MITFRLLVPAVDAIRPSTPLDVRDVPAVIVPPAGEDESADFAAWLDALAAETGASNRDAHMAAADETAHAEAREKRASELEKLLERASEKRAEKSS